MSRKKWMCLDCREDTGKMREHYFVKTDVWMKVVGSIYGMLCVGCLEKRLGRQLVADDFTDAHINNPRLYDMSDRLRSRLCTV
jgi:hypothetical protein